jgi:hypothetical protein
MESDRKGEFAETFMKCGNAFGHATAENVDI